MPLTNAEKQQRNAQKQQRWRDRNVVVLTGRAAAIAERLIEMSDQKKLKKVAAFINDHLRHPDRTPDERSIALGRGQLVGLNGPLSKTAAIAELRESGPVLTSSWLVEPITKDGQRWTNGVRLGTKAEAEAYRDHHACFELEADGYVTADICQDEVPPNCCVTRARRGGRTTLVYPDGGCEWLHWRAKVASSREACSSVFAEPP